MYQIFAPTVLRNALLVQNEVDGTYKSKKINRQKIKEIYLTSDTCRTPDRWNLSVKAKSTNDV